MSHKYQDLIAWQKAKALATAIYRATGPFPKTEIYGMPSQLRRAAISTASNIAEAPPARRANSATSLVWQEGGYWNWKHNFRWLLIYESCPAMSIARLQRAVHGSWETVGRVEQIHGGL